MDPSLETCYVRTIANIRKGWSSDEVKLPIQFVPSSNSESYTFSPSQIFAKQTTIQPEVSILLGRYLVCQITKSEIDYTERRGKDDSDTEEIFTLIS